MTWVAWRQHRWSVITSVAVIALAAVSIVILRIVAGMEAAEAGGAGCLSGGTACPDEMTSGGKFRTQIDLLTQGLFLLPLMVGFIAGAPLFARDISHGHHVFSLTQSISRKHWWAAKLVVVLLPIAVAMLLLGLLSRWLLWPILDLTVGPIDPLYFEAQGFAMVGYMTLAFALSATIGLLSKNIVVPMVVTIGVVLVIAFTTVSAIRPYYISPETATVKGDTTTMTAEIPRFDDAWPVGRVYIGTDGKRSDDEQVCDTCTLKATELSFQPADRFWAFQGIETGAYLVLAAGALALGVRGLRTRLP